MCTQEPKPRPHCSRCLTAFELTNVPNVRFPVPDGRTLYDIRDAVALLPVCVNLDDGLFVFSGQATGNERTDAEALYLLQSLAFVVIPGTHECQIRVELTP